MIDADDSDHVAGDDGDRLPRPVVADAIVLVDDEALTFRARDQEFAATFTNSETIAEL